MKRAAFDSNPISKCVKDISPFQCKRSNSPIWPVLHMTVYMRGLTISVKQKNQCIIQCSSCIGEMEAYNKSNEIRKDLQTMSHSFEAARSSKATGTSQGTHCLLDEEMQRPQKTYIKLLLPSLVTWDYQVKILLQITEVEMSNSLTSQIQNQKIMTTFYSLLLITQSHQIYKTYVIS